VNPLRLSLDQFDVHPHMIKTWKEQLENGTAETTERVATAQPRVDVKALLCTAKIGEPASCASAASKILGTSGRDELGAALASGRRLASCSLRFTAGSLRALTRGI
jgi:hypothetical protein